MRAITCDVTFSAGRFAASLLLLSCLGCSGRTHNRIDRPGKPPIYVGMTGSELAQSMGPPDSVATGPLECRNAAKFATIIVGDRTIEWAWQEPERVVVAWLDDGIVRGLGTIPKKPTEAAATKGAP